MATLPSIASVVAGARFRATMYNAIKSYLDFLIDTPHCSVYNSATTVTCPDLVVSTLITFDAEVEDTDAMHSTVSNTSRVNFVTAGRYELNVFCALPNVAVVFSKFRVNLRLNSAGSSAGGTSLRTWIMDTPGGTPQDFAASISRVFAAGDYVEVFAAQTSGASRVLDGSGPYATGLQARFIGLT